MSLDMVVSRRFEALIGSLMSAFGRDHMVLSLYLAVEEDHNLHLLHSSSTNSQERQD